MKTLVFYTEVPGFYAEVERVECPDLAGRPIIVGGDPRKGGRVQAATADAAALGVVEKMSVLEALERCPRARALPTDMRRYREADARLRACLRRGPGRLERAGFGAAFLDASGATDPPDTIARCLRERVGRELGLPLRVGAAPVKFVARLAAEESGEEGIRIVCAAHVAALLAPLPVARLPGVGPNTAARLEALGAGTVAELLALGREPIERALGRRNGVAVLAAAHGEGDQRVRASRPPRSLAQERTFGAPEVDLGAISQQLHALAEQLERSLRLESVVACRVALRVRYEDREQTTRSRTLPAPVATALALEDAALELLGRTQAGSRAVRSIGLAVSGLRPERREDRQLDLFPARR